MRSLKIIGVVLLGLVVLAVAREGWTQLLLGGLAVLAAVFIVGGICDGDL